MDEGGVNNDQFFFFCAGSSPSIPICAFPPKTIRSFIVLSNEIRFDEGRDLQTIYLAVLGIYAW